MDFTRGPYNDTPPPLEFMSKSTNISQSETKLTDLGSHWKATRGPTEQGTPSYASTAMDAHSFGPTLHLDYDLITWGSPCRLGPPLEYGPPPPGLRSGLSKKEKKDARRENRLKDSANPYRNPTTSYTPYAMQYPTASPESSVQRMHSSFHNHEHDSSAPRLPDTGDSRGEEGPSLNSAPPLDGWEAPIAPSVLPPTQNQPKHVIGVRSVNNLNLTVASTNPLPLPPSHPGEPQILATSSNTCNSSIVSHHL
jgi:hypothetical protein